MTFAHLCDFVTKFWPRASEWNTYKHCRHEKLVIKQFLYMRCGNMNACTKSQECTKSHSCTLYWCSIHLCPWMTFSTLSVENIHLHLFSKGLIMPPSLTGKGWIKYNDSLRTTSSTVLKSHCRFACATHSSRSSFLSWRSFCRKADCRFAYLRSG